MKWTWAVVLFVGAINAAAADPLPGDPTRGMTIAEPCVRCHGWTRGPGGMGVPVLAGQDEKYLVRQLREMRGMAVKRVSSSGLTSAPFKELKSSARSNHVMDDVLLDLDDQRVRDVAAFFAAMPCERAALGPPEPPPRLTARCASCHGHAGLSTVAGVPNLAGQDETYLRRQLRLFRNDGTLVADDPTLTRHAKIMETQVNVAPAGDIQALARYYARLPCQR